MERNKVGFCRKLGKGTAKTILKRSLSIFAVMLVLINILAFTAFAADDPLTAANLAGSSGPISTMYNFMLTISIPVAVVGLAMCGFSFFIPNEKGYEVAKKRIMYIGIALMVIILIPNIYKWSSGSGVRNAAWNPDGGNTQIIQNAMGNTVDLSNGPVSVAEATSGSIIDLTEEDQAEQSEIVQDVVNNSSNVSDAGPVTVPGAPTILNLSYTDVTDFNSTEYIATLQYKYDITVEWQKPESNGGADIEHYLVEVLQGGDTLVGTYFVQPDTYSCNFTQTSTSGAYEIRVAAVNSAGTGSYASCSTAAGI